MPVTHRVAPVAKLPSVRDIMSRAVVSGDSRMTLVEAAEVMRGRRVSALAVLDHTGAIVGIITERDLMRAVADGRHPATTHVSQYMTHSPITVEASAAAAAAARAMVTHHIRHLPVTEGGRLAGFVSARDLLALKPWPKLPIGEAW